MLSGHQSIRKVILIDDDPDDYFLFEEALKQVDPTIAVFHISGLKDLPAEGACNVPDLLFLDINMPDQNGFEWLSGIRAKGYAFPIVMYSTASNPAYVQKAYTEGATVYFTKPESYYVLKESLKHLLALNWQAPGDITARYCKNGQYNVFSLA